MINLVFVRDDSILFSWYMGFCNMYIMVVHIESYKYLKVDTFVFSSISVKIAS